MYLVRIDRMDADDCRGVVDAILHREDCGSAQGKRAEQFPMQVQGGFDSLLHGETSFSIRHTVCEGCGAHPPAVR